MRAESRELRAENSLLSALGSPLSSLSSQLSALSAPSSHFSVNNAKNRFLHFITSRVWYKKNVKRPFFGSLA